MTFNLDTLRRLPPSMWRVKDWPRREVPRRGESFFRGHAGGVSYDGHGNYIRPWREIRRERRSKGGAA